MTRPLCSRRHDGDPGLDRAFTCLRCGRTVPLPAAGTAHRNHCPACLWSRHVDLRPGDRRSPCQAPMEPIALWIRPDGEWALIHRCTRCASLGANRIAGDDAPEALRELALRPLHHPAAPLETP